MTTKHRTSLLITSFPGAILECDGRPIYTPKVICTYSRKGGKRPSGKHRTSA